MFGDDTLKSSIEALGFGLDQITDVFLTHLHFDHCGGGIVRQGEKGFRPFLKMLRIGVMKNIGTGQQNQMQEKKRHF